MVCTYTYTGGEQTLYVPVGLTSVGVSLYGAAGGGLGGVGAQLTGSLPVTANEALSVFVGGTGDGCPGNGGLPDGGAGGTGPNSGPSGCAGGGGTQLYTSASTSLVAEAGGGGGGGVGGTTGTGGGGGQGGNGIGDRGSDGSNGSCNGQGGAGGAYGGLGGGYVEGGCSGNGNHGGANGTQQSGGAGGPGTAACFGFCTYGGSGGGGGGGWVGGGGGGGGGLVGAGGGGGGGGASEAAAPFQTQFEGLAISTPAEAVIGWERPPATVTLTSPPLALSGASTVLSATVSAGAQPISDGAVTFTVPGNNASCTANVVSGSASCSVAFGAIGPQPYTATYGGDAAVAQTTASGSVTVQPDPTSVSPVVATVNGGTVLLTTGVSWADYPTTSGYVSVAGDTVTFYYATAASPTPVQICQQTIPNSPANPAAVSCAFTPPAPGVEYLLTASYGGDQDNSPSATPTPVCPPGTTGSTPGCFTSPQSFTTTTIAALTPTSGPYGTPVQVEAQVQGIPAADTSPGTVTFYSTDSTLAPLAPVTCAVGGQAVGVVNGLADCTFTPDVSDQAVEAVYSGDAETTGSSSANAPTGRSVILTITAAATNTAMSFPSAAGGAAIGVPVTIDATVTDASNTGVTPGGSVEFLQLDSGSGTYVPVPGCSGAADVGVVAGVAACTPAPPPTALGPLGFEAVYCPVGSPTSGSGAGDCANWVSSNATSSVTVGPDPTTLSLSPTSTSAHPISITANTAVTVTATLAVTAGTASPAGKVSFTANGAPISGTTGSCSGLTLTAATPLSGTVTCTFIPQAATTVSVVATYNQGADATDPNTAAATSTGTPLYYLVGATTTLTTLQVVSLGGTDLGSSAPYGQAVLLQAQVLTAGGSPAGEGIVDFSLGNAPITSGGQVVCQNVPVVSGSAQCQTALTLPAGAVTLGAAYSDVGGSGNPSAGSLSFTTTPDPTTATVTVSPDPTLAGRLDITDTVVGAPASSVAPAGAVAFSVLSSTGAPTPIAGCTAVPVVAASTGSSSSATCTTAATPAGTVTTYSATYTPTSAAEFSAVTATVTYTALAQCSSQFGTLWSLGGTGTGKASFTVAGGIGSVGLALGTTHGACNPTAAIPVTATASLFGTTLGGASLTGFAQDGSGGAPPQLCLTGGSLDLPSGWKLPAFTLGAGNEVCFGIATVGAGGAGSTLTGFTMAQLAATVSSLPFGLPDASIPYRLSLVVSDPSGVPTLTAAVAPSGPLGTTPYVDATVTVTVSGGTVAATGSATLGNLFAGGNLTATFTASAGSGGALAGSITVVAIPKSGPPIQPVPGLQLQDVVITLSSTSGLAVTAQAILGASGDPLTVNLAGGYQAGKWTLVLSTTTISFTPTGGLTFNAALSGSATITTSGAVTFDFEAGAVPSASSVPLVSWAPGPGLSFAVDCVALAYGMTPSCGSSATTADPAPAHPTLVVDGSATIGGGQGFSTGILGSLDLRTGAFSLTLDPTASSAVTIAPGLTATLLSLAVTGGGGQPFTIDGQADVTVAALGSTPITLTILDDASTGGSVVLAASGISFAGLGVNLTGFFAYASGPVASFDTGDPTFGTVKLPAGFTAMFDYVPSGAVTAALSSAGFTLPPGGAITFVGSWNPGGSPTFSATITPPAGFPFLKLPGGATIDSASVGYASDTFSLALAGTIPIPGAAPAKVAFSGSFATDGTLNATASITGLSLFGQVIDLSGTVTRSAGGAITADVTTCAPQPDGSCQPGPLPGTLTPFPALPSLTLTDVSLSLGTAGLAVSGTAALNGLGSLALSGSLQSLDTWTLTVAATAAQVWQPVPQVSIDAALSGTLSDASGVISFDLKAAGVGTNPLFSLSTSGVTVSIGSIELGSSVPPTGCSVSSAGDVWLDVNGALALSLGSINGSAAATGCFDLTAKTFSLSATVDSLALSLLGGHLNLSAPTITLAETSSGLSADIHSTITVQMPSGGSFSQVVTVQIGAQGFVAGAEVNLSTWLGSTGNVAYVYYASAAVTGFNTGDPTIAAINLPQGLSFALSLSIPASAQKALAAVHLNVPTGTSLTAIGTADFTSDLYMLKISINLGANGVSLFNAGGASLSLDSGYLEVTLSPTVVNFGMGLTATLDLPSAVAGDPASQVALDGQLTAGENGGAASVTISLSVGNCGSGGPGWIDAFGIPGLTIQCAALQVGVTTEFPFVTGGLSGTVTGLPSVIANVAGYQQGAPITFAFNLDPFLLDLSIGTKGSTTPALEPFAVFGQPNLVQVDFAQLYISPQGATIGQVTYPAGFGLGFQAQISGTSINILANIGFNPPSINFTGDISQFNLGPLSIGPVSITLAASTSPPSFMFQLDGAASLGPGSVQIGPALDVGGSLAAQVEVDISTSGISVYFSGSLSLQIGVYVATQTCYQYNWSPYGCDYKWEYTGFSATIGRTGFSIDSSGITLAADGYSVTFGFDGSVTATLAAARTPAPLAGGQGSAGKHASAGGGQGSAGGRAVLTSATLPGPSGGNVAVVPSGAQTVAGTWSNAAPMATPRALPMSVTLPDGSVLVAGGGDGPTVLASAEIYDPRTGSWRATTPMGTPRVGASAVLLPDGDVLVAGGTDGTRALASAEIYDPRSGRWSQTGSMRDARAFAGSAVLASGDVLVAGGEAAGHRPLSSAELYNWRTGRWSVTGSLQTARAFSAFSPLPGGGALTAGGEGPSGPLSSAERYDPSRGTWSPAAGLATPRLMATGVRMPNGRVLVVGGAYNAELYDPASGKWSQTPGLPVAIDLPGVAVLPDASVLVAGGTSGGSSMATTEVFDPATDQWASGGALSAPTTAPGMAVLPDGRVLLAGGEAATSAAPIPAPPGPGAQGTGGVSGGSGVPPLASSQLGAPQLASLSGSELFTPVDRLASTLPAVSSGGAAGGGPFTASSGGGASGWAIGLATAAGAVLVGVGLLGGFVLRRRRRA